MSQFVGIARPYAKAVFQLAKERKALEAWSAFLATLKQALSFEKVRAFLKDPSVGLEERVSFVESLVKDSDLKGSTDFIRLVMLKKRALALPFISDLFEEYKCEWETEKQIQVIGAYELNDTEKQLVSKTLEQKFNQKVKVSFDSDPDLMGGVLIKVNDWVIDASIRGKLTQLQNYLIA